MIWSSHPRVGTRETLASLSEITVASWQTKSSRDFSQRVSLELLDAFSWLTHRIRKSPDSSNSTRSATQSAILQDAIRHYEFFLEQAHAAELTVAREDVSYDCSFGLVYDQLALAHLVPERHQAAHPDALALGGGDLVADELAGHLVRTARTRAAR
jgi:hypothetical protein